MIKEWATVVSWQSGMALVRCEPRSGCGSCQSRTGCESGALKALESPEHQLLIPYRQPLQSGQRVEIGVAESSLLRSAVLMYLFPLLGLMVGAGVMQALYGNDILSITGALAGVMMSFWAVRLWADKIGENSDYQPVILQVSLPESLLRVESFPTL
ncbi:SoxR-reducing system protein RseC [Pectobacteriaceae bacterium CE70]|uniref:SoxR reducing system protein RseC n=1 Tax=Serratia sp. (strain ATCC 39006) TaxID=104623 RepID=A0A2I5TI36_SERS3|nr:MULTISPECIES: SoxR-reducing system protein RseC [Enterobacterales]WJV61574.1 SoxR-reducing system protein RseC [Pectobacteriaceae bacterium C52]WJV65849.1 SoxR-reducing system protein RseC [Pectobacteriaceae bacterium CE70]WJY09868.1 SoxR-reducing system protein RseC [Pectobacteriaceae bacterium C80]AUG99900.1 SoxR reducing system protein RseC [Serratia sp. ATCC 39006]AUH04220.1 SoxR reducing system protein RseC [Serratia sp. ATCC 39006]